MYVDTFMRKLCDRGAYGGCMREMHEVVHEKGANVHVEHEDGAYEVQERGNVRGGCMR